MGILVLELLSHPLAAQSAGPGPWVVEQRFISWQAAQALPVQAQLAEYKPTQWKKGALIGAGVGLVLATLVLTTCDTDASIDCPGWDRAAIAFGASTGLGALIGAFFHKSEAARP